MLCKVGVEAQAKWNSVYQPN